MDVTQNALGSLLCTNQLERDMLGTISRIGKPVANETTDRNLPHVGKLLKSC
jgi:hypothetical protein